MSADPNRNIHRRRGRIELSMHWPSVRGKRTRFRRAFPTLKEARLMRGRIEAAIAMGTWRELKAELRARTQKSARRPEPMTLSEFAPLYLEHIRARNRRPDFHEIQLGHILPGLGDIRLDQLTRSDAIRFREQRVGKVTPATANRAMAVLRGMLNYAVERGDLAAHPLSKLRDYPEKERALRVMSIEEERAFIAALFEADPAVGIYAGVLGETALRPSEGLRLGWRHVDLGESIITVELGKVKRPRYLPISPFCRELLGQAVRVSGVPHVFVRPSTLRPVKDTRGAFGKAQRATGLGWVHPEDFRHFRATQWVRLGVDLKTVQELLGHADIHTTMRYAHFAPHHAARTIAAAMREEAQSLAQLTLGFKRGLNVDREVGELERLFALEPSKSR